MDELSTMALDLHKESQKFKKLIHDEYVRFEQIKLNLKREKDLMTKRGTIEEEVIELNVGGETFTTFKSTLVKAEGSMLSAMFSGNFIPGVVDKNGRYFLDRPPQPFGVILNALRTSTRLQIPDDGPERKNFIAEIKYYGLKEYFKKDLKKTGLKGSSVLNKKEMKQLEKWIGSKGKWKLIYKATKDGFDANVFRSLCANKGPTITVIKSSTGYIFGGYTPISWSTSGSYAYDNKSFLFSFKNASGNQSVKIENNGPHHSNQYSIYNGSGYGPTFGGGHDLYICSGSNSTNSSYTNLGHSYSLTGFTYSSTQIQSYLAGSYNFTTSEIEVFSQ